MSSVCLFRVGYGTLCQTRKLGFFLCLEFVVSRVCFVYGLLCIVFVMSRVCYV